MSGSCRCCAEVNCKALIGLVLFNSAVIACSDSSSFLIEQNALRDSASIRIAESRTPVWIEADAWVMDSTPTARIGGEVEDSVPLVGVQRARVLADGRIVVANGRKGINEVLMFDSLGHFDQAVGGPGKGPGEFSRVDDFYKCSGDTLVVNDFSRASVFDAQGEFVRTTSIRWSGVGGRRWFRGVTADCATWLVQTYSEEPPRRGTVGIEYTTLVWSQLDRSRSDTIAVVPNMKLYNRIYPGWENQNLLVSIPWGQLSCWTMGRTRAYVGITDRPEVRVYENGEGLVQIIRWVETATPINGSDRRRFAEKRARWLPKFMPLREIMPPIREYPEIPDNKPLFNALLLDDEGNLWVGSYPDFVVGLPEFYEVGRQLWERDDVSDEMRAWRVFDEDGRLLGVVDIPAKLHVLAIERGHVITVSTDEYDVEVVELYRLTNRQWH